MAPTRTHRRAPSEPRRRSCYAVPTHSPSRRGAELTGGHQVSDAIDQPATPISPGSAGGRDVPGQRDPAGVVPAGALKADVPHGDSCSFDELLRLVYAGAHDTPPWKPFLLALEQALQVDAATLVLRQPTIGDEGVLISVDTDRDLERTYRLGRYSDDPFLNIVPGYVYTLEDVISEAELHRTAYYRELMAPDGVEQMMALNVIGEFHGIAKLRLARRRGNRRYGIVDKSFCARLAPHLAHAVSHYGRITIPALEHLVYGTALEQMAIGIVILRDDNRVLCMNSRASLLLGRSGALSIHDGELRAVDAALQRRILECSRSVRAAWRGGRDGAAGAFNVPCSDSRDSLQVLVRAIPLPEYHYSRGSIGLALFIGSARERRPLSAEVVARLFGLSPAESVVVLALAEGASPAEAARTLGVAVSTVRSQLRSIYAKTGVRRQADLVSLVYSSTAILA